MLTSFVLDNNFRIFFLVKLNFIFISFNEIYFFNWIKITIHEIYLGKYKEMDYNNISEKEKNLAMLNCTSIKKMEELVQGSKIRGKIMEKFKKKLSAEEFAEILFDPEEDQEMILNSERLEGAEQKQLEIAKKLLDKNMDIQDIADATGLPLEKVKELLK